MMSLGIQLIITNFMPDFFLQTVQNEDLFLQTRNNIKTILSRYSIVIMHDIVFLKPSLWNRLQKITKVNICWDLALLMLLLLVFFCTMFQNEWDAWYHGSDASVAVIHKWGPCKFAYSTEQNGKNTQTVSKQERWMIFPCDVNIDRLIVSKQHYLILKGCIIWYNKHFSSYEARATKLVYHIQRKMRGPDGRSPCNSVNVLLRKAYMLYRPSARDSHCFPDNVFAVIWFFPPVFLPTNCWSFWKKSAVVQEPQAICWCFCFMHYPTYRPEYQTLDPGHRKWL